MAGAIPITRNEMAPAQLRPAAGWAKDGWVARRMLALALVLEGIDRKTAAESCGMDRQTLRDWVHRYNAEGLGWSGKAGRCRAKATAHAGATGQACGLGQGRA